MSSGGQNLLPLFIQLVAEDFCQFLVTFLGPLWNYLCCLPVPWVLLYYCGTYNLWGWDGDFVVILLTNIHIFPTFVGILLIFIHILSILCQHIINPHKISTYTPYQTHNLYTCHQKVHKFPSKVPQQINILKKCPHFAYTSCPHFLNTFSTSTCCPHFVYQQFREETDRDLKAHIFSTLSQQQHIAHIFSTLGLNKQSEWCV